MKRKDSFVFWVATMLLMTVGLLVILSIAIPSGLFFWWQDEWKLRKSGMTRSDKTDSMWITRPLRWFRDAS